MTNSDLKQLYEKLYFSELESREKIHARLQLPLTLQLAVIGAVVFMFQNFDYQSGDWNASRVTFAFFFCGGAVILAFALGSFVQALYNNAYYFLPVSQKTEDYRLLLEETYKDYDAKDELVSAAMDKYLIDSYIRYSTFNTQVNDRRSAYIHICNGAIIGAALLFSAAYFAFYFGDLDKSRLKPASEVVITKPVDVRIQDERK